MVCSIGRARVGQDDNVKRATENVQQRVALIRDGFPRSCTHLRDAQLYRSAFERRSTADTRLIKDVRFEADWRIAGRALKVSAAWWGVRSGELEERLPLHGHYAIHLPFAFHALAHPCFCPLLSTSLLLPTTLLWKASELIFCLSLLPPSILLIYSSSSSLKLILNISIFLFWFLLLDEKEYNNNKRWFSCVVHVGGPGRDVNFTCLCEYVIVHTFMGGSPVILWISQGGKPKWLPLKMWISWRNAHKPHSPHLYAPPPPSLMVRWSPSSFLFYSLNFIDFFYIAQ